MRCVLVNWTSPLELQCPDEGDKLDGYSLLTRTSWFTTTWKWERVTRIRVGNDDMCIEYVLVYLMT